MVEPLATGPLGTILSIWAHPDDETYLSGGIMTTAAAAGQRVVCVSATAGERGTDDPQTWPPERLGPLRRAEARAAMDALGVEDHRFLDYPDGGLAELDPSEPVARIVGLIEEIAPDTILTFGPDGMTFHPDHQTVSAWVGTAWSRAGGSATLLHAAMTTRHLDAFRDRYERWSIYMTDERPTGVDAETAALVACLDGSTLDRKMAALAAMPSQTAAALAFMSEHEYRENNAEETFVHPPVDATPMA